MSGGPSKAILSVPTKYPCIPPKTKSATVHNNSAKGVNITPGSTACETVGDMKLNSITNIIAITVFLVISLLVKSFIFLLFLSISYP